MDRHSDTLETIFEKALSAPKLFSNHDALRSDYVPEHLPFRDEQISSVGHVLSPLLHSSKPSNLLIYGKTGTGKTAATKHVLSKLSATSKKNNVHATFVYSNVRIAGTEYRVLAELAAQIGLSVPFTGLAVSEVLSRLQNQIKSQKLRAILVLDEIDYLVKLFGDRLLYDLTTSSDAIAPGFLSIVGISNDLQFKEGLGARVISRLSEEEIVFPPYTAQELTAILHERTSFAFNPGAYTEAAVNLCAALSGSEHGDARRAVDLLRIAGEVAEREGSKQLEDKHVRVALQKIDQDRISDALKSLPLHAKLVLLAAVKNHLETSNKSSGSIYENYSNLCKISGMEALTTRRVSGLVSELDTLGLVTATLVNYGRYGRTKKVTPQISQDVLRQAFQDDSVISQLLN
ncbi:MAG TPA: orc1/cdc6 family replication initiation protein [Nitrososphaerales archaeon]|nr:orc1/cdc6 family replication initiation protein [Nitrososphaerales archaeon]